MYGFIGKMALRTTTTAFRVGRQFRFDTKLTCQTLPATLGPLSLASTIPLKNFGREGPVWEPQLLEGWTDGPRMDDKTYICFVSDLFHLGPVHTSVISSGELAAASYLRLGKPRCIDLMDTGLRPRCDDVRSRGHRKSLRIRSGTVSLDV
jgi:hypothetical protein